MSLDESDLPTTSTIDKGKRRADIPTERTPLLQNGAYGSTSTDIILYSTPPSSRRRLCSVLTTVFLVSLSTCLLFAIFLVVIAWSYASRASRISPERVLNEDVVLKGPFRVDVLNTTHDGGLWLNLSGLMGFDAGDAIGVNHPLPGEEEGMVNRVWKAFGRWGIRRLEVVTVELNTVHVAPEYDNSLMLLEANLPPIEVPLTVDPRRRSNEWLTPVATEVFVRLTKNSTLLTDFMTESWKHGTLDVDANVGKVKITGGGKEGSWKANFHGTMKNIQTFIRVSIPSLPGLPHPGKDSPFPSVADFLTLKTFRVSSQHNLSLYAEASVLNPLSDDIHFSIPSLPFVISLPNGTDSPLNVANVISKPFESTHPNITIHVAGTVPALPNSSFPLLSTFLSRYLNGKPNPILISTPLLSPGDPSDDPGIQIPAEFPGPTKRPDLLRNVTIKNMKIRPSGTTILASGTVFARVVLPMGMDVGVDVFRVFPDVLLFDGEAPLYMENAWSSWPHMGTGAQHRGVVENSAPPPTPTLPDPLPPRAFGHIRPDDWLPSSSVRLEDTGGGDSDNHDHPDDDRTGAVYAVSAQVVDIPLEMLPGRSKEFTSFVRKVIFGSGGALAGIEGYAAVTVEVDGLPSGPAGSDRKDGDRGAMLELTGLPVHGSVRVGKKSL